MSDIQDHVCARGERYDLTDARGIFCCYVCDKCDGVKRRRYRADIFTDGQYPTDEPVDED